MLEKQKEWCQNKVEKGKKWVKDHKFWIGYGVGIASMVAVNQVVAKIFEPKKYSVDTMPIEDGEKSGFAIRTSGIDRFGGSCCKGPWVCCYEDHDRDHIVSNIDAAIRNEMGQYYED